MAWTYNDYESQTTDAERLTRLRLHIQEVSAAISADVSADGKSRSSGSLMQFLETLHERRRELERATGQGGQGTQVMLADFRGGS